MNPTANQPDQSPKGFQFGEDLDRRSLVPGPIVHTDMVGVRRVFGAPAVIVRASGRVELTYIAMPSAPSPDSESRNGVQFGEDRTNLAVVEVGHPFTLKADEFVQLVDPRCGVGAYRATYRFEEPATWVAFEKRTSFFLKLIGSNQGIRSKAVLKLSKLCSCLGKFFLESELFLLGRLFNVRRKPQPLSKDDVLG